MCIRDRAYAAVCPGEPKCHIPKDLPVNLEDPDYRFMPYLDSISGYCVVPLLKSSNETGVGSYKSNVCPEGYTYFPWLQKCASYPICGGNCVWDLNVKKCVYGLPPTNGTVPFPPPGGGEFTPPGTGNGTSNGTNGTNSTDEFYCFKDLNGNNLPDKSEIVECVPAKTADGKDAVICPIDLIPCQLDTKPAGCANGTVFDPSLNLCISDPSYKCNPPGNYSTTNQRCEAIPVCPSGATYDITSGKCVTNPTCPAGSVYDSSKKLCVATNLSACPSGYNVCNPSNPGSACCASATVSCPSPYWYNGYQCQANPDCNPGWLTYYWFVNRYTCVVYPYSYCEFNYCPSGFSQAEQYCARKPVCPAGGYLAGMYCYVSPIYSCPYSPNGYWVSGSTCYTSTTCPSGFTIGSDGKCYKQPSCPSGFTLGSDGKCYASGTCPSGYTFNGSLCVADAQPVCPPGTVYDSSMKKCKSYPECPPGYTFNSTSDMCIAQDKWTCPATGMSNGTDDCTLCPAGSTYDSSTKLCVYDKQACPPGWRVCNSGNLERACCTDDISIICPESYVYNGTACVSDPKCDLGNYTFYWFVNKYLCVIDPYYNCVFDACPPNFHQAEQYCAKKPDLCTGGGVLLGDKCIASPTINCPSTSGTLYVENGMCYTSSDCPPGSIPGADNKCYAKPYCATSGNQTGSTSPCFLYNGQQVCSLHQCEPMEEEGDRPPFGYEDDEKHDESAYNKCLGTIYIFNGKAMRCRQSSIYTGFHDCCDAAKGRLYDSTGSTGLQIVDAMKAAYAALEIVKTARLMRSVHSARYVFSEGPVKEPIALILYDKNGNIITSLTPGTRECESWLDALSRSSQTEFLPKYTEFTNINKDQLFSSYAYNYLQKMGPQIAYQVVYFAFSKAINDPILASAVNVVAQAVLVHFFPAYFSPVGLFMAALELVLAIFTANCDSQDILTSTYNKSGYCFLVEEDKCIKRFMGACLQRANRYCCFNSKLARIIHEQGRKQLSTFNYSLSPGTYKRPNCRGFTPEEFQALDFSKIDFSEYIEDLTRNIKQNIQPQIEERFNATIQDSLKKKW